MIKKLSIALLLTLFVMRSQAQTTEQSFQRHEFTVGAGLLGDVQLITLVGDIGGTLLTLGYGIEPGTYQVLTPFISYRYWFSRRFGLEATFAFDVNSVMVWEDGNTTATGKTEYKRYFPSLIIEATFAYLNSSFVQLYGRAGFGITFIVIPESKVELKHFPLFNFQISPLGIRVGKSVAGFMEIGYGYRGLINAGVSIKI